MPLLATFAPAPTLGPTQAPTLGHEDPAFRRSASVMGECGANTQSP